jgi:hypothetical protein
MVDNWFSYFFYKINLLAMSFVLFLMGCGKVNSIDLPLSEEGPRGSVLAFFYQDDQVYQKELGFRNVDGQAVVEGDVVLGEFDQLSSKSLSFVLTSANEGAPDFGQFVGVQSLAFAIQDDSLFVYDPVDPNLSIPIQGSITAELAGYILEQSLDGFTPSQCRAHHMRFSICTARGVYRRDPIVVPSEGEQRIRPSALGQTQASSAAERQAESMSRLFGICHTPRRQPGWRSPRIQQSVESTNQTFNSEDSHL